VSTRPAATTQRSRARTASRSTRRRTSAHRTGKRRRKTSGRIVRTLAITAAVTAVVLFAAVMLSVAMVAHALTGFTHGHESPQASEAAPPPPPLPAVAGYGVEQLAHACTILTVGRSMGLGARDQTIAVMTAMGESSLRNLTYGDWETSGVTNPDGSRTTSIGLFQQQDGWGSSEARLDPATSARLFYRAMTARVPEREALEPTLVAHRTQINADPRHYARYWHPAERVIAALNGEPLESDSVRGIPACPPP
jgi:hypothetical protein